MFLRKFSVAVILFLSSFATVQHIHAQKVVDDQTNAWLMYFGNHRLSTKWGLHTEYQFRRSDGFNEWQQSLLRFGADYYVTESTMLTAGYAWIRSWPYGKQPIAYPFNEHRIWQQLILNQNTGRFYFNHRYRLEQRFLERKVQKRLTTYQFEEFVFRQRARYRLYVSVPINRNRLEDKTWFLGLYDEVFIGFGEGIQKNVLDQNRLYAALGYRVSSRQNIQMGYLNHHVFKSDGIHAERNHTFQLSMQYNLDFR